MAKEKVVDKNTTLNNKLDEMVMSGMLKTRAWTDLWQLSLRYFFGDQLLNKRRHANWDWVVVNYIWPTAMQEIAKLTKNFPVLRDEPLFRQAAGLLIFTKLVRKPVSLANPRQILAEFLPGLRADSTREDYVHLSTDVEPVFNRQLVLSEGKGLRFQFKL